MNVVYSYIGSLPEYAIDTVYQTRLFYNGPIYFIVSDTHSPIVSKLINEFNVEIIPYESVISDDFNDLYKLNKDKFMIFNDLVGREKLFIYAYERYFLLYNVMVLKKLTNVFFMEVDNLIYDNPVKWLDEFSKREIAFMYDNHYRCGAGICYIKNMTALLKLNIYFVNYIMNPSCKMAHEMKSLHDFWESNPYLVQLLPTHWPNDSLPIMIYDEYENYNNTIFDVAGLGIYLGGMDPYHTKGIITKGLRGLWSFVDYTPYQYDWKKDDQDRKIPYIWNPIDKIWLKINNLHIHSKELKDCLSK
jgi:hypothetical protein